MEPGASAAAVVNAAAAADNVAVVAPVADDADSAEPSKDGVDGVDGAILEHAAAEEGKAARKRGRPRKTPSENATTTEGAKKSKPAEKRSKPSAESVVRGGDNVTVAPGSSDPAAVVRALFDDDPEIAETAR